jgi:hypothetical protein
MLHVKVSSFIHVQPGSTSWPKSSRKGGKGVKVGVDVGGNNVGVDVGTCVEVDGGDVGEGGSGVTVGTLSLGEQAAIIMRRVKPTTIVTRMFISSLP